LLAVRNTHPEALTPTPAIAYHSGGLYEVLIGAIVFAIAWPLRNRLRPWPLALIWLMLALLALGRFFEYSCAPTPTTSRWAQIAQWTRFLLLAIASVDAWLTLGRRPAPQRHPRAPVGAKRRRQLAQ
jgi:protein-S-isoprenylcysteine O-methyltransferase Ste14